MSRLRFVAPSLVLIALAACTHGLELENGERPVQPITRISFLFSEGQSDILLNQPDAAIQAESGTGSAPVATPDVDVDAIVADDTAMSLVVPAAEVDPSLQTTAQEADPRAYVTLELMAESQLTSFFITGSRRQSTASPAAGRPFQLVQRLFVHRDTAGADRMFQALIDETISQDPPASLADAAVGFFRQIYPDLTASAGQQHDVQLGDANHLVEIRIEPGVEPGERQLGPGDPHIYFLLLRQGRVTALFELYYLSAQDPATISVLGERLINRIPAELAETALTSA